MHTTIDYRNFQGNLDATLDGVCSAHDPVFIERDGVGDVVLLSRDDYSSLLETLYLFSSSENAGRLLDAARGDGRNTTAFDSVDDLKTHLGL